MTDRIPSMRRRLARLLLAGVVIAAACSGEDAERSPRIVVTTTIWADVVDAITCNGLAEVIAVIPARADPHTAGDADEDRERMLAADVVVANGLGLESGLAGALAAAADAGVAVVEMGGSVDPLRGPEGDDPHVWLDPQRIIAALPDVADRIVDAADLDGEAVEECLNGYLSELAGIDAEVVSILAGVPPASRGLVVTHDSLGYLADRYGLEVLATVTDDGTEGTGAVSRDELGGVLATMDVPVVFARAEDDVQALARQSDALEVVRLDSETLGAPGDPDDSYFGLLVTVAADISAALGTP